MQKDVISISDLHCPFENKKAVNKMIDFVGQTKPHILIANGDLKDMFSFSKHERNPWAINPAEELSKARKRLEEIFWRINKKSKKTKIIINRGNHCVRLDKRIKEKMPELIDLLNFDDLWTYDNAETILDPRETVIIDGVIYIHGWMTRPEAHLNYFQQSVCFGHIHRSYIIYRQQNNRIIFEANSGHMSDMQSVAMSYMPSKVTKSICSFYYKDSTGPRIILT